MSQVPQKIKGAPGDTVGDKEICSVPSFIDRGQVQELERSIFLRTPRTKEDIVLDKRSPESPGNQKVGRQIAQQPFRKSRKSPDGCRRASTGALCERMET